MLGAIAGDIIGSVYEFKSTVRADFELFCINSRFTDDTVLTVAVADCVLNERDYQKTIKEYGRRYPNAGYGLRFEHWLRAETSHPYNSFGNGSAMRVSPIGFAFNSEKDVLEEAKKSAEITHNHPEGIKGAQATALAIFLARQDKDKKYIKNAIEKRFGYNLNLTLKNIRPGYKFDETCQGSVPQSIIAFLESDNYEETIRNAVSLGGDSDTMACIAGGIAQAYYKEIPKYIIEKARALLTPDLLKIVDLFNKKYGE